MSPSKIMITGANIGLGKDSARQLALKDGVEKIILACRNEDKAKAAKEDLEKTTGKKIFDVLIMDVSDLSSVKKGVSEVKDPIDGLILNAGGAGGKDSGATTDAGVLVTVAVNVLGHAYLVDLLLEQKKLSEGGSVVYSGSEAARGIPSMGMKAPEVKEGTVDEFAAMCDGKAYKNAHDFNGTYPSVKMMGALWMSHMARNNDASIRFVTMSPGGTTGTNATSDTPLLKKMFFVPMMSLMKLLGKMHGLETGAQRYVDALCDDGETYKNGVFYASKKGMTGEICDQSEISDIFKNETYQDNCNEALHKFIK